MATECKCGIDTSGEITTFKCISLILIINIKSNNFIINLPRNIKDIVKMKVLNVILPSNIPEIHTYNNNNNFLLKVWNCKLCKFDEFVIILRSCDDV